MNSDRRWTGGLANREWQRGTRAAAGLLDTAYLAGQVRAYLADCYTARAIIKRKYHPTEDGILHVIPHRGRQQEEQIRAAFREGYQ